MQEKITSLEEFLGLIKNARFVFTASYHGMLFAIYYQKEFVFYTRAHSDRVLSLAKRLGAEDRCGNEKAIAEYGPMQYDIINDKVTEFRQESIAHLQEMLRR